MMGKIKQGDEIVVRVGKDRGKRGKVAQIAANGKVMVDGINLAKKESKTEPKPRRIGRHNRKRNADSYL